VTPGVAIIPGVICEPAGFEPPDIVIEMFTAPTSPNRSDPCKLELYVPSVVGVPDGTPFTWWWPRKRYSGAVATPERLSTSVGQYLQLRWPYKCMECPLFQTGHVPVAVIVPGACWGNPNGRIAQRGESMVTPAKRVRTLTD